MIAMARQTLLEEFKIVLDSVRSRSFPYIPKKLEEINWSRYDEAQQNEYPDVMHLIACIVDTASSGTGCEARHDATGRNCCPPDALAKFILAQQYEGRCNRVSIGFLNLMKEQLLITYDTNLFSYKTLERAYSDPDVMALLNDTFFLTQQPVRDIEHNFAIDGTCFGTTIKVNWESAKDEIIRLNSKGDDDNNRKQKRKGRKRREFEKAILVAGTTFKIISSFAITKTPFGNESPYLKPLLEQIAQFYACIGLFCADAAYLSRSNCSMVRRYGAVPRIFPKDGVSLRMKGSGAWKKMLVEFVNDTQKWLEDYHKRSIVETINSTIKRVLPCPIRKKLVMRKATEMLARICVYNIRQLVYLRYTKGIELKFNPISQPPNLLRYINP